MTKSSKIWTLSFFFSFLLFIFTGCEGFFQDNELESKIKAAIDYANAPTSSFVVNADNGTGTIIPSGTKEFKPTDYYNIEFTLDSNYEFIEWEFLYKQFSQEEGSVSVTATDKNWWKDYVTIIKQTEDVNAKGMFIYTLQIQFTKSTNELLIKPKCAKKPSITKIQPEDKNTGVPAATPLQIDFDLQLTEDSFIYTNEELKEFATQSITQENLLKRPDQKVYGYKTDNGTKYKSIKILVDGSDYTDYFSYPVINTVDIGSGKYYSTISLEPQNVLPCPEDTTKTAVVTIELDSSIKTIEGASLTPTKRTYRINSNPLEFSIVNLSEYDSTQGHPTPDKSQYEFGVGKQIELSYKENPAYKFLYWETNNPNIKFEADDTTKNPTKFYTMSLITAQDKAKIIPVSIARPKFDDIAFKTKYSGTQYRDQDIELEFDKNIIIPDSVKKFTITCAGKGDVSDFFKEAQVVNGNKIQILANTDYGRIPVNKGETYEVTVNIPDSIYYVYHDTKTGKDINVTLGNTIEKMPKYTIDNSTQNKATVSFSTKNGEHTIGTITVDNENVGSAVAYDIGREMNIKFRENADYEFLYWTTSNDNIEIDDVLSNATSFKVIGTGACTLTPVCAEKLKLNLDKSHLSAVPLTSDVYTCDSDIYIESNIKPEDFDQYSQNGNSVNCVRVIYNNINVVGINYKMPVVKKIAEKYYITLECKEKLEVNGTATVRIEVDNTLYYEYEDSNSQNPLTEVPKISLAAGTYTTSFTVSEKTRNPVYVKILTSNVTLESTTTNSIEPYYNNVSDVYVFNENSAYDLNYTINEGAKFKKWLICNSINEELGNSSTLPSPENCPVSIRSATVYGSTYYTLVINSYVEGLGTTTNPVIIKDDSVPVPVVQGVKIKNTTLNQSVYEIQSASCDSNIYITFNKEINPNTVTLSDNGSITITKNRSSGDHFENRFDASWNEDHTILVLSPDNSIKNLVPDITSVFDFVITLNANGSKIKDTDGVDLEISSGINYSFDINYRINGQREQNPPVVTLSLSKPTYGIDETTNKPKELSDKTGLSNLNFESGAFEDDTYIQNHVGKKVYFTCSVSDTGETDSGFEKVTITETLIKTVDGADRIPATISQTIQLDGDSDFSISETGDIYSLNNSVIELKSEYDGVIRLDFTFTDYAGNPTLKRFYVIKDTKVDASTAVKPADLTYSMNGAYLYGSSPFTDYQVKTETSTGRRYYNQSFNLSSQSLKDVFYNGKGELLTYKFYWGTKKNQITTEVTSGTKVYTFNPDADKDCFVKIIGYDSVGNYTEIVRAIPRQINVIKGIQKKVSGNDYAINLIKCDYQSLEDLKQYYEAQGVSTSIFYAKVTSATNTPYISSLIYKKDNETVPVKSTDSGIYKVYIQPYFQYSERRYYGPISEPFTYYHNTEGPAASSYSISFDAPTTYEILEAPENSGIITVSVPTVDTWYTSAYTYGVYRKKRYSSDIDDYYYSLTPTFNPSQGSTLYFYAINNTTGEIKKGSTNYDKEKLSISTSAIPDNVPPTMGNYTLNDQIFRNLSRPDCIRLSYGKVFPQDSKGLYLNDDGKVEFNYYMTQKTDGENYIHDDFTREKLQLLGVPSKTVAFAPEQKSLRLPYTDLTEGLYVITFDIADKNNNNALFSYVVSNQVEAAFPKINKYFFFIMQGGNVSTGIRYIKHLWVESDISILVERLTSADYTTDNVWTHGDSHATDATIVYEKGFYRVLSQNINSYNNFYKFKLYSYIYYDVALREGSFGDEEEVYDPDEVYHAPVCSNKSVIPGLSGAYQIYYDAPVFAHTMAFRTDMLNDLTEKAQQGYANDPSVDYDKYYAAVWETKGFEYGLKYIDNEDYSVKTSSYVAPVSEIPSGYSYVTIFHFADGTYAMSDVKQK